MPTPTAYECSECGHVVDKYNLGGVRITNPCPKCRKMTTFDRAD